MNTQGHNNEVVAAQNVVEPLSLENWLIFCLTKPKKHAERIRHKDEWTEYVRTAKREVEKFRKRKKGS